MTGRVKHKLAWDEIERRAAIEADAETDCENCDGFGRVWNNADPTSGQRHPCEVCDDPRGQP